MSLGASFQISKLEPPVLKISFQITSKYLEFLIFVDKNKSTAEIMHLVNIIR